MAPRHWFWRVSDYRCRRRVGNRPARDLSKSCAVVRGACQTSLQSTQLDLCTGLDNPLRADGVSRMANFAAAAGLGSAPFSFDLVLCSARAQCGMVVDVLWRQQSIARPYQHRSAITGHSCHCHRVPSARQDGGLVPRPACRMGWLCERSQCRDLAVERVKCFAWRQRSKRIPHGGFRSGAMQSNQEDVRESTSQ